MMQRVKTWNKSWGNSWANDFSDQETAGNDAERDTSYINVFLSVIAWLVTCDKYSD